MPFLMNPDEAEVVIKSLLGTFNVEIYFRKVSSYPLPQWEQVPRIRDSMQYQRQDTLPT